MAVSKLAPMRYKTFVWPHNPRTYTIEYERRMAAHDVPHRKRRLEDMGLAHRVMRGEGEFIGPDAYDTFRELACLFYETTPGVLVHPVWQTVNAYFVELALEQEPRPDYVRYSFAFWECADEERAIGLKEVTVMKSGGQSEETAAKQSKTAVYHTVVKGDTLWQIGRDYSVALTDLIAWNPQIKNPNLIYPGEKVRVSK